MNQLSTLQLLFTLSTGLLGLSLTSLSPWLGSRCRPSRLWQRVLQRYVAQALLPRLGALGLLSVLLWTGAICSQESTRLVLGGLPFGLLGLVFWSAERERKRRLEAIDKKVEPLLLALARALTAAPSLALALRSATATLDGPLAAELGRVLRELDWGRSLSSALDQLLARAPVSALRTAVSVIKLAERSGGSLESLLQSTAAALRELDRLEGVMRAKTAEGKAQAWVIAVVPIPLVLCVHAIDPLYFAPLEQEVLGLCLFALAVLLWTTAIILARRILAVEF